MEERKGEREKCSEGRGGRFVKWREDKEEKNIRLKAEDAEVKVKELKETHKVWKEEQEKENVSFKKIVNEQVLAKDEVTTEKVINVIKRETRNSERHGREKEVTCCGRT